MINGTIPNRVERAIITIAGQGPGMPLERMLFLFQRCQPGIARTAPVWGFILRGRSPGRTVAR